jgi:hypothetical protein
MSEASDQARGALYKAMNERCSNFDRGTVFHWAERGMYIVKEDATPTLSAAKQLPEVWALRDAAKCLAREMAFLLRTNPKMDGGLYREALDATTAALAPFTEAKP